MSDSALVTIRVPRWIHRPLAAAKRALTAGASPSQKIPNLLGDRDVEWSWIAANLPRQKGRAMDFGCGSSFLGLAAAQAGYEVVCCDLSEITWLWKHPRLEFRRGDILIDEFETASFDLVINCSAIEHVGLSGRYGVDTGIGDGDLQAMRRLADLMKPGGLMLLTIPVGRDAVFEPMTRIYGSERLPRLIDGFAVETESYWIKDDANRWFECDRETALAVETWADSPSPLENFYGTGCFRLRKPTIATDRGAGESC